MRGHGRLDGRALCPRSPGDRYPPGPQSVGNRASADSPRTRLARPGRSGRARRVCGAAGRGGGLRRGRRGPALTFFSLSPHLSSPSPSFPHPLNSPAPGSGPCRPRVPPGVSASGEGETHPEVCAGREVGVVLEVGHVLSSEVFFKVQIYLSI